MNIEEKYPYANGRLPIAHSYGLKEALVFDYIRFDEFIFRNFEKVEHHEFNILKHITDKKLVFCGSQFKLKVQRLFFISGLENKAKTGVTIYMDTYKDFKKFVNVFKTAFGDGYILYCNYKKVKDYFGE